MAEALIADTTVVSPETETFNTGLLSEIDKYLAKVSIRDFFSSGEVEDMLLDMRNLATTSSETE